MKNLFIALLALQPAVKILFIPTKRAGGNPKLIADRDPPGTSDVEYDLIGHHRYYGRAARP